MNDEPNVPLPMGNDPAVERWLDGLGRFNPRPGFEDRVVNQVRVPLPHWLGGLRDRFRGLVSGVTGWTLLATASLVTAAAWGSMIAAGIRYRGVVTGGVSFSLREVIDAARQGLTDYVLLPVWRALGAARDWLAASGLPVRGIAIGYAIVVLVSAIVVWRLMAEPAQSKGAIDATQ
jgi:sensor domain CHASE-containing protein